jgi:hypothetical protein
MEVQFSNAELARVLLQPRQMRVEAVADATLARKSLDTQKTQGAAINEMIVQATQLGRHLDISG